MEATRPHFPWGPSRPGASGSRAPHGQVGAEAGAGPVWVLLPGPPRSAEGEAWAARGPASQGWDRRRLPASGAFGDVLCCPRLEGKQVSARGRQTRSGRQAHTGGGGRFRLPPSVRRHPAGARKAGVTPGLGHLRRTGEPSVAGTPVGSPRVQPSPATRRFSPRPCPCVPRIWHSSRALTARMRSRVE